MPERPRLLGPALAFGLFFVCHGAFILHSGPRFSPDSRRYDAKSEKILRKDFDLKAYLLGNHNGVPNYLYIGFELTCALSKIAFGRNWHWGIVLLNLLAQSVCGAVLVDRVYFYTRSVARTAFATAAFLTSFEMASWSAFVLSDTLFLAATFFLFLSTSIPLPNKSQPTRFAIKMAAFAAALILFRPTGIFVVVGVLIVPALTSLKSDHSRRLAWATITLAVLVMLVVHSALILQPELWPFETGRNYLAMVVSDYRLGIVIYGRPETYLTPAGSMVDVIRITLAKFAGFFSPYASGYSSLHNLISALNLVPLYAAVSLGFIFLPSGGPSKVKRCIFSGTAFAATLALFHAMTQVEFDWRYRAPILPILILMASLSPFSLSEIFHRRKSPDR